MYSKQRDLSIYIFFILGRTDPGVHFIPHLSSLVARWRSYNSANINQSKMLLPKSRGVGGWISHLPSLRSLERGSVRVPVGNLLHRRGLLPLRFCLGPCGEKLRLPRHLLLDRPGVLPRRCRVRPLRGLLRLPVRILLDGLSVLSRRRHSD